MSGAKRSFHAVLHFTNAAAMLGQLPALLEGATRAALWVEPGLNSAVASRRVLLAMRAACPRVEWAVLGPKESMVFFEMEPAVAAFIPVLAMQARRPGQPRLAHWWQARQQLVKLGQLGMHAWVGVESVQAAKYHTAKHGPSPLFATLAKRIARHHPGAPVLRCALAPPDALNLPAFAPLQLGPSALARATAMFRAWPPTVSKHVLVLGHTEEATVVLQARHQQAMATLPTGAQALAVVLVYAPSMLVMRLRSNFPNWHFLNLAECLGVLAYADRVMGNAPWVTLLMGEMGRLDRMVLDKTHSQ